MFFYSYYRIISCSNIIFIDNIDEIKLDDFVDRCEKK